MYKPDPDILIRLESLGVHHNEIIFYRGKGCDHCSGTGFWGRVAIYEFFLLKPEIKELIVNDASEDKIRKRSEELGMETLLFNGIKKVREGLTTIDEILRII